MTSARLENMNGSAPVISPLMGSRATAAMAGSMSALSPHRRGHQLGRERSRDGFELTQEGGVIGRGHRIEQERRPPDARRHLLEQFHPLSNHLELDEGEAG